MKKTLIVTLLCVNAVMLLALILYSTEQPAFGQVAGADYLVVTARAAREWDAVYVLDLSTRRLVAVRLDQNRRRITPFGGVRDLTRDFGRRAAVR